MNSYKKDPISIILCVFGYQDYIGETIESILKQTFKNIQIVLIDDCNSYDLKSIVEKFNDSRIEYHRNYKNMGLTRSILKAGKLCKGKYIAMHDAGNISLPERIQKQYEFLESNNSFYLVGSSAVLIDENSREICERVAIEDTAILRQVLAKYNCMIHSTIMFKNDGNIFYREKFKYAQDYDFYLNLISSNKVIGNIREPLLKERFITSSITFYKREQQQFFSELVRQFYFERMKLGNDSYKSFYYSNLNTKIECGSNDASKEFNIQKIYYLFYGLKLKYCRSCIRKIEGWSKDKKLLAYYFISFFPIFVKMIRKLKKIKIR
jgi:glycosyltransferase involved in cell wall biosynthesis